MKHVLIIFLSSISVISCRDESIRPSSMDIDKDVINEENIDLGIGFVEINNSSSLELFREKTDTHPERELRLPETPLLMLFYESSRDQYLLEYDWLTPEAMSISEQRCLFRVIKAAGGKLQVETNRETKDRMWLKRSNFVIQPWEEVLKKYCMLRSLVPQEIKSAPNDNAETIQVSTHNDFFNAEDVQGDWVRITTNRIWEHLAPNGRINDGWMKWKEQGELKVKLYTDIDTGGVR